MFRVASALVNLIPYSQTSRILNLPTSKGFTTCFTVFTGNILNVVIFI